MSTLLESLKGMEKVNLGYSVKNIPLANGQKYKAQLVEKIEAVIKRMRWKAIFFMSRDDNSPHPVNYGLPTTKCPGQVKEMVQFENELLLLAKDVQFSKISNTFQSRMNKDMKAMRDSGKTLTPADKTTNMYRLSAEEYNRLKLNAVTSKYKKASAKIKDNVEKSSVNIVKKAGVLERMSKNGTNPCFITLKDHKPNFQNNPATRLINPAKNEVGRISKVILDRINLELKEKLKINQWKSNTDVIKWFSAIRNKSSHTFTVFDIKDFYPSITESLLKEAIEFAKQHVNVSAKDLRAILQARKSLLFNDSHTWIKKEGGLFDVTMGAYDGAEVCELVGTYLLHLIGRKYKNVGLYRDDGLAAFKNMSGPQAERVKKDIQKIFKDKGLEIIIQCNLKVVDYLDLTFNLNDGSYRPYRKPDDETSYIHVDSDHPPIIIKQVPIAIERRLSVLSSSEQIFDEAKGHYQEALEKSGHKYTLKYKPPVETENRRRRSRNIIWFNPPFSKTVTTSVGKKFLSLLDKHFPRNHKFRKIFNRNTVKVSYGCMPNIAASINAHNKSVTCEKVPLELGGCNCTQAECPLDGHCLSKNVFYEATLTADIENYGERLYKGIAATTWKERYGNHLKSFNDEKYEKETELSKEVWRIKRKNKRYAIKWRLIKQYPSYNPVTKRCILCLQEKIGILETDGPNQLNKRSEIVGTCRHRKKHMLSAYDVN